MRRFEAEGMFSGPSVYFHHRAIARRRAPTSVTGLLADERFLEYVYITRLLPGSLADVHEISPRTFHPMGSD
ncbi:hypothetical protein E1266_27725 [Actinomadura sp. 7K534]|nr:hypothetical protein E1266_27725 [Actinomadura sp. 7K534]